MPDPKQPADHQPKKSKAPEPDEFFTFTSQGEQHTMAVRTEDALGARFVRENRRRDSVDFSITAFEALAGTGPERPALMKAFDAMGASEWRQFQLDFERHLGATLGE